MLTAPTAAHTAGTRDGRRSQLRTGARSGADAVAAAHRAARDTKRADGPHLRVTLRLGLATRLQRARGAAARRRRLRELVGGFDLVTTPLRSRTRHRHPGRLLAAGRSGPGSSPPPPSWPGCGTCPPNPSATAYRRHRPRPRPRPRPAHTGTHPPAADCPRSSASQPSSASMPIDPIASPRTDQS